MHSIEEPQEPQEISDMFAEIDQALDELDDVVAGGEGTEVYALYAEPISFSLVPLVDVDGDDGEQRVRDEDVILDEQCAEVVGDAKQGDEPDEVLEKNGVRQDGALAEDKF